MSKHRAPLSSAMEDYLKTIYMLCHETEHAEVESVSTQALADRLEVRAPSVTAMIKKLAALKLVRYEPYKGVTLTKTGLPVALEIIRHHRLVETYLAQVLGMSWDQVHEEADRWEHVLGEEVEEKMAKALGNPKHDPHGAPIPAIDEPPKRERWVRLSQAVPGKTYKVCRVLDESASVLQHLHQLQIRPGSRLKVMRAEDAEGVLHLKVNNKSHIMGLAPARTVAVAEVE